MSGSRLTISSDTLFHFTNDIGHIINILENEFRPHFSLEDLRTLLPDIPELEIAVPMVCFCDIPLSQAKNHMDVYGYYGIGLNKEWGIRNKISPVLYAYEKSAIIVGITQVIDKIFETIDFELKYQDTFNDFIEKVLDEIYGIIYFIKPYNGNLSRNGKNISNVRFYDEREWRFVPKLGEDFFPHYLSKEQYENQERRKTADAELKDFSILKFEPEDIKYIIVENEKEIIPIIEQIERIRKYDDEQVRLLCSRVISSEQILKDF